MNSPDRRLSRDALDRLAQLSLAETRDGHHLVAETLHGLGVSHVYTVSGVPIEQTLGACARTGIRVIGVRHQQAAVMMAAAHNYAGGRLTAVAVASLGPALTNAATGILVAHDNCWPVLVLGSRCPLNMRGMGVFQELDAVPIFAPMSKRSVAVTTTDQIPGAIVAAFHFAIQGRPGPVYLEFPQDMLAGTGRTVHPVPLDAPTVSSGHFDPCAIRQAADILTSARRPLMVIGKGVRWSEPYAELRELLESMQIPFVASPMGRGFVSDDHPLCFNAVSHFAQSRADAVLILGARLDWTFRYGAEFPPDAKLIQVDIHAPTIGLNRMPSVAIVADVKQTLRQLLGELNPGRSSGSPAHGMRRWSDLLESQRLLQRRSLDTLMQDDTRPMSPYRMMKEIRDFLPPDAISVLDGNVCMAVAQHILPARVPVSRFTAGSNGCMGVGIPFAIGAKLARPDRLVLVISGDAAFGFNAMELETAVRHGIPIVVVIANNDGISGALKQEAFYPPDYPERVTMFQPGLRYERITEALGGFGEYVEDPRQLRPALERAAAAGTAACINVRVDSHTAYPAA